MKKIITFLFILMLSLSSICTAFEPPDPDRWLWVGSDAKIGVWIDKQTFQTRKDLNKYSSTYGCRFANVWEMWYDANENTSSVVNKEYNLDRRLYMLLSSTHYDDSGNVVSSSSSPSRYITIVPNSWGESIFEWVDMIYAVKTNPSPKSYNPFLKS